MGNPERCKFKMKVLIRGRLAVIQWEWVRKKLGIPLRVPSTTFT